MVDVCWIIKRQWCVIAITYWKSSKIYRELQCLSVTLWDKSTQVLRYRSCRKSQTNTKRLFVIRKFICLHSFYSCHEPRENNRIVSIREAASLTRGRRNDNQRLHFFFTSTKPHPKRAACRLTASVSDWYRSGSVRSTGLTNGPTNKPAVLKLS